MHIILDTNILLNNPKALAWGSKKVKFIIPTAVLEQLRNRASRSFSSDYESLISAAQKRGVARVVPAPSQVDIDEKIGARQGYTDFAVLATAYSYKKTTRINTVYLATDDRDLIRASIELGINSLTTNQLYRLLALNQPISSDLESSARALQRRVILNFLTGTASGIVISFLGIFVFRHWTEIRQATGTVFFVFAVLCAGPALYFFRSRFRTIYGLSEVIVGLYISISQYSNTTYDSVFLIKLLGGLYIIVRGMDNMEKNIDQTIFGPLWRRMF